MGLLADSLILGLLLLFGAALTQILQSAETMEGESVLVWRARRGVWNETADANKTLKEANEGYYTAREEFINATLEALKPKAENGTDPEGGAPPGDDSPPAGGDPPAGDPPAGDPPAGDPPAE